MALEKMSVEELGDWMIERGFGEEIKDAFMGKCFTDNPAILQWLLI